MPLTFSLGEVCMVYASAAELNYWCMCYSPSTKQKSTYLKFAVSSVKCGPVRRSGPSEQAKPACVLVHQQKQSAPTLIAWLSVSSRGSHSLPGVDGTLSLDSLVLPVLASSENHPAQRTKPNAGSSSIELRFVVRASWCTLDWDV